MSSPDPRRADRVAGTGLVATLDLSAAVGEAEPPPGMLTPAERAAITEVVRTTWRGEGAVVDLGSFLGSSLLSEAQGMVAGAALGGVSLDRFPDGKPIHGYDLGVTPAPARPGAPRRRTYGDVEIVLGESFVPALEQTVAPHRDLVALHLGDLLETAWDGSPIEVAHVDVCKTAALNAHVSRQFLPALVTGGVLVQQDFFYNQLPWIRVTMGHLADHVSWEGQVATSSYYRVVRPVPESLAAYDPFTQGSLEECLALHDAGSFPGIDRTAELMLALSRVELVVAKGSREHARELLVDVVGEFADLVGTSSEPSSYRPASGTADTARPRYRLDRTVNSVLGTGSSRSAPEGGGAVDELAEARAALAARDWDRARALLRPLQAGDVPAAVLLLARTEHEAGRHDEAMALVDRLLARRPRHPRARALRARLLLDRGDATTARAEAEQALETAPDLLPARRVLFDLEVAERLSRRG